MNYNDRVTKEYVEGLIANAGAKIVTGSYIGTGTFRESSPTTLTFSFTPKLVFLFPAIAQGTRLPAVPGIGQYSPGVLIWGATDVLGTGVGCNNVSYSGNTISWWNNSSAQEQYNTSGLVYYYAAIG